MFTPEVFVYHPSSRPTCRKFDKMNKTILIRGGGRDLPLLWITRSTSLAEASSRTDTCRLHTMCVRMCVCVCGWGAGISHAMQPLASRNVCSPAKVVSRSHCSLWKGSLQRVETKRSHCSPQKRGDMEDMGPKSPRRTFPVLLKKLLSFELLDVSRELASEGNVVLGERWEAKFVGS